MKFYFMLLTAMFYSLLINAQKNDIFKNKTWEDFKKKEQLLQKLKPPDYLLSENSFSKLPADVADYKSVFKVPLTGTFIKNTGKGTNLYTIDLYNMPCVTPDKTFASNMPVLGSELSGGYRSPLKKETEGKK